MTGEERPVQLYVYDLSRGMARQFSMALVGRQFDAVYHTSVVVGQSEIYFGAGIQYSRPGATHHGAPMEKITLGTTSLPDAVIEEFIESMKEIYSPESYDLFMCLQTVLILDEQHNCNNFSNDFAMFLTGKGIPKHIVSLPQDVLNTPFGQMLRPQLEASIRPITTAPTVNPSSNLSHPPPPASVGSTSQKTHVPMGVRVPSDLQQYNAILQSSVGKKLSVVFFTSAGCPPCRVVYPHFEQLAEEYDGKGVFIKVDVGKAYDIGSKYQIRATPTFMTFINGELLDQWTGVHPGTLKANVSMAINAAYPPHPHTNLRLPVTLGTPMTAITYSRVPPLEKVIAKMGDMGKRDEVVAIRTFIADRQNKGAIEATLPDLPKWSAFLQQSLTSSALDSVFPIVDLFRLALMDPRVCGFYAEEKDHATINHLLDLLASTDSTTTPYSLRLVSLQALCNLFVSPLFPHHLLSQPLSSLLSLTITNSLLDAEHPQIRVAASSLAFNIASYNQKHRTQSSSFSSQHTASDGSEEKEGELLSSDDQVQLTACLVEAIERETESHEAFRGCILALALLVYGARMDGEVIELVTLLQAGEVVMKKGKTGDKKLLGDDGVRLCKEVGEELLTKGLKV